MALGPFVDCFGQGVLAADRAQEIDFGRSEVERRRSYFNPGSLGSGDDVPEPRLRFSQDVGHGPLHVGQVDSQADREVGLSIHVDAQHAKAALREGTSQIDGRGRLADSTFLVCDRDDVGHRGFTS